MGAVTPENFCHLGTLVSIQTGPAAQHFQEIVVSAVQPGSMIVLDEIMFFALGEGNLHQSLTPSLRNKAYT